MKAIEFSEINDRDFMVWLLKKNRNSKKEAVRLIMDFLFKSRQEAAEWYEQNIEKGT